MGRADERRRLDVLVVSRLLELLLAVDVVEVLAPAHRAGAKELGLNLRLLAAEVALMLHTETTEG